MKLNNVTLVCVTSVAIEESINSIIQSSRNIEFAKIKLITDVDITPPENVSVEKCKKLNSLDEYSKFIIYELHNYIDTDFCMIVQHDGKVINSEKWLPEFLNYDYIGAPWPIPGTEWMSDRKFMNSDGIVLDTYAEKYRVGNGGFNIRSKRLLTTPTRIKIQFEDSVSSNGYFYTGNEDWSICVYNRHLYEQDGNVFAPLEIASIFSKEGGNQDTFGKHR